MKPIDRSASREHQILIKEAEDAASRDGRVGNE
jgi:hypothetical protein